MKLLYKVESEVKKITLGFLIAVIYLAILVVNGLFFKAYIYSYKTSEYGERREVKVVEMLRKPGGGRRGYIYQVNWDGKLKKVFIKTKLELNKTIEVIVSPIHNNRIFVRKGNGSAISIFHGLTGSWFLSFICLAIHFFILKATYMLYVKIPMEYFKVE